MNMEKSIKKKRMRTIALIAVAIAIMTVVVLSLNIEKADYAKSLDVQITEAEQFLKSVEIGYNEGQYPQVTYDQFKDKIIEAKGILVGEASNYELHKATYEDLRTALAEFKKAANDHDLTKAEIKALEAEASKNADKGEEGNSGKTDGKPLASADKQEEAVKNNTEAEGTQGEKEEAKEPVTVTVEIRCDSLSQDTSKVQNENLLKYIPKDGTILATTKWTGTTENTVFDALSAVCRNNGIQMESAYTPGFNSYYVEAINYLYEFDGGSLSGWMYTVNGEFPNYGSSSFYLSDGDKIVWRYTCDLGQDIGGARVNQN